MNKMMIHTLLFALLSIPTGAISSEEQMNEAQSVSPHLIEIRVFGRWSKDGAVGDIRYLMFRGGYEEVHALLFIQWIEDENDEDDKKIISTVEVVPGLGNFDPPKITSTEPYVLHVEINSMYCKERQNYDITLTGVGKYKRKYLNKTPCKDDDGISYSLGDGND